MPFDTLADQLLDPSVDITHVSGGEPVRTVLGQGSECNLTIEAAQTKG